MSLVRFNKGSALISAAPLYRKLITGRVGYRDEGCSRELERQNHPTEDKRRPHAHTLELHSQSLSDAVLHRSLMLYLIVVRVTVQLSEARARIGGARRGVPSTQASAEASKTKQEHGHGCRFRHLPGTTASLTDLTEHSDTEQL